MEEGPQPRKTYKSGTPHIKKLTKGELLGERTLKGKRHEFRCSLSHSDSTIEREQTPFHSHLPPFLHYECNSKKHINVFDTSVTILILQLIVFALPFVYYGIPFKNRYGKQIIQFVDF